MTAENLAALGAERLAALLMELGEADAAVRKRLVLALAERGGAAGLIKAVDRRLAALAGADAVIPWEKEKAHAAEIDGLRTVIVQSLAPLDAPAAAERLARLTGLAPAVLRRVDDSHGRFDDTFREAAADLAAVWTMIEGRDPEALADATLALIRSDAYGQCDGLIAQAAPALGAAGLAALKRRAAAAMADLDETGARPRHDSARFRLLQVLRDVADAQEDVDGLIAAQGEGGAGHVDAAGIASRLIEAGRADEALVWLDGIASRRSGAEDRPLRPHPLWWEHDRLRIAALEQLGRRAEAQTVRWRLFEETLSVDVLRAYLRALPDFEDDAALEKAFALAARHRDALGALTFLTRWPTLPAAARLTLERLSELDGRYYELLGPAAEVLSEAHALAATLIRRRMIDSVLDRAAATAYPHAAKNLAACQALDDEIDWSISPWPSHADYVAGLLARHGRKYAFWSRVKP